MKTQLFLKGKEQERKDRKKRDRRRILHEKVEKWREKIAKENEH